MIDNIAAEYLLANRGYDTNLVLASAREYDAALYPGASSGAEWIWQVEGAARRTRYAQNVASYLAICQICILALWAKII